MPPVVDLVLNSVSRACGNGPCVILGYVPVAQFNFSPVCVVTICAICSLNASHVHVVWLLQSATTRKYARPSMPRSAKLMRCKSPDAAFGVQSTDADGIPHHAFSFASATICKPQLLAIVTHHSFRSDDTCISTLESVFSLSALLFVP
jgi:hypothetical protein